LLKFIFRFFKNALAATKNLEERNLILRQIRDVETEILARLRTERERMERENANMAIAIAKLNKLHGKKQ
jgi:hypothetical protein